MSNTSLPIRLLAAALILAGGCRSRAIHTFPVEHPPDLRAARPVEQVAVYYGETAPGCAFHDVAMLSYDWARDGIMTSQDVALEGLRRRAAEMGASGVRAIEMVPGANVSMGMVTSNANISGSNVSSTSVGIGANAMEFGARGVAYYCVDDELRDRAVTG